MVLLSPGGPGSTAAPETAAFVPTAEDAFETAARMREVAESRAGRAEVNRPAAGALKHAQVIFHHHSYYQNFYNCCHPSSSLYYYYLEETPQTNVA